VLTAAAKGVRQDEIKQWLPVLAGGSLIAYGLGARNKKGAAAALVGGSIIWAGTRKAGASGFEAHKTVTVNAPPEALYQYWRHVENLPSILRHLDSVQHLDDARSYWVAKSSGGQSLEWQAEIVEDQPNERISWISLPSSEVYSEGSVDFTPGRRGTQVRLYLRYEKAVAMRSEINEDLRRFKQLMETGEILTTRGQPSGR